MKPIGEIYCVMHGLGVFSAAEGTNDIADALPNYTPVFTAESIWSPMDQPPPDSKAGVWSSPVVAVDEAGDLFRVSYMGDADGGTWQRPFKLAEAGTRLVAWTHLPDVAKLPECEEWDLSAIMWEGIQKAASESNWLPKEYFANDWASDVQNFLRYGPDHFKTFPDAEPVFVVNHCGSTFGKYPNDSSVLVGGQLKRDHVKMGTKLYTHPCDPDIKKGIEIIEAALKTANEGDIANAPFPLVGLHAEIWLKAQAMAYAHCLEMLNVSEKKQ
jgi:hypothetical protein